jgi:hypothetical protein
LLHFLLRMLSCVHSHKSQLPSLLGYFSSAFLHAGTQLHSPAEMELLCSAAGGLALGWMAQGPPGFYCAQTSSAWDGLLHVFLAPRRFFLHLGNIRRGKPMTLEKPSFLIMPTLPLLPFYPFIRANANGETASQSLPEPTASW